MAETAVRVDTLPPTQIDATLAYPSMPEGQGATYCRVRVYQWPDRRWPVIVVTEDPLNPGQSVTNAAEVVFFLAWERAGFPWPAHFVEHYQGNHYGADDPTDTERFACLAFQKGLDGRPRTAERNRGRGCWPHEFAAPRWEHLDAGAMAALLGTAL